MRGANERYERRCRQDAGATEEKRGLPSAEDLDAVAAERELVAKSGAAESYDVAVTGVQD